MPTCSNCCKDVGWDFAEEYADGGMYCDYCIKNSSQLRERLKRVRERNKELGHTGSDMCCCSMCAANYEKES